MRIGFVFVVIVIGYFSLSLHAQKLSSASNLKNSSSSVSSKGSIQLSFVPNKGQVADMAGKQRPDILYTTDAGSGKIFLRKEGLSYVLLSNYELKKPLGLDRSARIEKQTSETKINGCRVDIDFKGCDPNVKVTQEELVPGTLNFYYAHCPHGVTQVNAFNKIKYHDLYKNIDLVYYGGRSAGLKYDLIVRPNGNVSDIKLAYKGVKNVSVEEGRIRIETSVGQVNEWMPKVFQVVNNHEQTVKANYILSKMDESEYCIQFAVEEYDHSVPLIIDPWITYYGGSATDLGVSVTTDISENVIFSGSTTSINFPVTAGSFQTTLTAMTDAYVVSMQPSGAALNFATYYGGTFVDYGFGVTTDAANNVIFCGETGSADLPVGAQAGFFVTQPAIMNTQDGFVVKLNSLGVRLFGTFCGGDVTDNLRDICTDASGNMMMIGLTSSSVGISTPGVFQTAAGGSSDAFVKKLLANGTLAWGTYLAGSSTEQGFGIACNKATGELYATGVTTSPNFSVMLGYQMTNAGLDDAFLVKLSSSGTGIWSTFYGGTSIDAATAVEVDGAGNVIIGGVTQGVNPVGIISTPGAYQTALAGDKDAFIVKFNAAGSRIWATYLGGSTGPTAPEDHVTGIGIDPLNNVVITGNTYAHDFPTTPCAYQPTHIGNRSPFISTFSPTGNIICCSYLSNNNPAGSEGTYFGGGGSVSVYGCHVYLVGFTFCNFPVTSNAYQTVCGGNDDVFLGQLSISSCGLPMTFPVSLNVSSANCACNGVVTASISPSCKIPPFSYFYSNATQTLSTLSNTNTASGFCAGNRSYTVATMCDTVIGNFIVAGSSSVGAVVQDPNCFSTNGTITINSVANATPNYTITEGATIIGSNVTLPFTFTASVGSHTYIVTGSNTCTTTFTANVLAPVPPLMNTTSPVTINCIANTVTLTASTTPTSLVTYTWTGPSILSGSNTPNPVVDQGGTYNLAWQYGFCSGTNSVSVIVNTITPNIFATGGGTVTCSILGTAISATSNVNNATYTWMPQNLNTNTVLAFSAGFFTVTITDPSNGCTKDTSVYVWQNTTAPSISATTNGSITCTNTLVVITGTSSTSGATYSWNPSGATTNTLGVTAVSIHTLIVTDPANGCSATQAVTVYPITAFNASVTIIDHVKCHGASTGSVQINTLGGSGIFSITVVNTGSLAGIFNNMPDTVTSLAAGSNTLFILDTLSGCTQVVSFTITQPPALNLSLILLSVPEICEGEPVSITSQMNGGVRPYQYNWLSGLGSDSTLNVPGFSNSYTLVAADANSCIVTAVKNLTVNPKPQIALLNGPISICAPSLCVNFTLAASQNTTFVYNWEITDANGVATPIQINQYNPNVCFSQPGLYNVDLNVISLKGCATQSVYPQFIKLYPVVKANYIFGQPEGAYIFTDVLFESQSIGASWFSWYNENDLFSNSANPNYIFNEPGQYLVSLIASNPACSDTISKYITVNEATFMHVPNAFTPNKDGLNDVWQPVFYGDFQSGQYELTVFDRWGHKVFWTVIIDTGWDGTFKDKPCGEGVYNWEIKLNTNTIANKEYRGTVTLYR